MSIDPGDLIIFAYLLVSFGAIAAFVLTVHAHRPWEDPFPTDRPPRTETDEITLHRLRWFLEAAGALRKRGRLLQRTQRGGAMATTLLTPATLGTATFMIEEPNMGYRPPGE